MISCISIDMIVQQRSTSGKMHEIGKWLERSNYQWLYCNCRRPCSFYRSLSRKSLPPKQHLFSTFSFRSILRLKISYVLYISNSFFLGVLRRTFVCDTLKPFAYYYLWLNNKKLLNLMLWKLSADDFTVKQQNFSKFDGLENFRWLSFMVKQ